MEESRWSNEVSAYPVTCGLAMLLSHQFDAISTRHTSVPYNQDCILWLHDFLIQKSDKSNISRINEASEARMLLLTLTAYRLFPSQPG